MRNTNRRLCCCHNMQSSARLNLVNYLQQEEKKSPSEKLKADTVQKYAKNVNVWWKALDDDDGNHNDLNENVNARDHGDSDDDLYITKLIQSKKRKMLKTEREERQDESMFLTLGLVTMMTLLT